ncbi:hypothetical protein ACQ4M3_07990 [Leptolyngbya sp. AN03gr2]|uniref:DUF7736 domain-containing protein n=1 Tax=unclassified Leptolyngbya TaxID=2650499 RepID=UPI003D318DD6
MQMRTAIVVSLYTEISCANFNEIQRGLHQLCGHDDPVHDLPRLSRNVKPYLLEQFPWLADINQNDLVGEKVIDGIKQIEQTFGVVQEVIPIPSSAILEFSPEESFQFAVPSLVQSQDRSLPD